MDFSALYGEDEQPNDADSPPAMSVTPEVERKVLLRLEQQQHHQPQQKMRACYCCLRPYGERHHFYKKVRRGGAPCRGRAAGGDGHG